MNEKHKEEGTQMDMCVSLERVVDTESCKQSGLLDQ